MKFSKYDNMDKEFLRNRADDLMFQSQCPDLAEEQIIVINETIEYIENLLNKGDK